jgi:hypothetical protein
VVVVVGSRKITIFFKDKTESGRLKCQLSNWNGIAYKVPRNFLGYCKNDDEFSKPGVYMLFGKDIDRDVDKVYIGEAENLYARLQQHLPDDFWNEIVIFASNGEPLNKAHIKNIENKLYHLAKAAERFQLANSNEPTRSALSEEDEDTIDGFIEKIKLIVKPLGYNLFEPIVNTSNDATENTNMGSVKLTCKGREFEAYGYRVSNGFSVLKGSKIKYNTTSSKKYMEKIKWLREINSNNIGQDGILVADILFSSPSSAADFVTGNKCNGLEYWKTENGKTLKQLEAEVTTIND